MRLNYIKTTDNSNRMDLTQIKSAVFNQLTNTTDLESLKIQNHLYGCFIVMEDIAQNTVGLSGTIISTPKFTFDLDKHFNELGIRFGFAMDTKLRLDSFHSEYKEIWLKYFKAIHNLQDIAFVDNIEDCLIAVVQNAVPAERGYFINSLDTGSLPQEWLEKVFRILEVGDTEAKATVKQEEKQQEQQEQLEQLKQQEQEEQEEKDQDLRKTGLAKAMIDRPRRRLTTTRRLRPKVPPSKKILAKTRRHISNK